MKKFNFLLILIFISNVFIFAQTNSFVGKNAWLYDSVLSSEKFAGRKSGTEGAVKAAEWISGKFKEWDLKAGGDNNFYTQKFPMLVTVELKLPVMIIKNAQRGELALHEGDDFTLFTNSGSGKLESDIIFIGYGLSLPEWDDYKDVDVKGKVVLILDGYPEKIKNNLDGSADRNYKFKLASKKGVAGVLICRYPSASPVKGAAITKENYDKNIIGAYIPDWVTREILKGTTKTIEELKEGLKTKTQSFNTKKRVYLEAELKEIEQGYGENIIGIIPGEDPVLKNEYVVFGAHMDHLGKSPNGYLYSGSDDNGSGSSLVMELARSLKQSGMKFKRSLVFICFGGEEQGLLGSNYYVQNPTIPKDKIATMVNFDMVGVGNGGASVGGIESIRKYWNEFSKTLSEDEKKKVQTYRAGLGGSDYTGFKIAGIPALNVVSSGPHKFYHIIEDNYKYVQPEVFDFVGKFFNKFGKFIGAYPESLLKEYRDERTLLNSCSLTDLNKKSIKIEDIKTGSFAKEKLERGIKITEFNVFNPDDFKNTEEALKKSCQIMDYQKENNEYLNIALNEDDLKGNVNGSKLVGLAVLNEIILDPVLFKSLSKLGLRNYKVQFKKDEENNMINFLTQAGENNCAVEIQQTQENIIDFKQLPKAGNIILSGDIDLWNKLDEPKIKEIRENKLNCILYLDVQNYDQNTLIGLLGKFNKNQIHVDIEDILDKNEKLIYELIKKMKSEKCSDEDIRNIFGGNLIRFY